MKTLKIITSVLFLSLCLVSTGQTTKPSVKLNTYFVQTTHTPEQCLNNLDEMKTKGDAFLSKFEYGCNSGNHTGYAFLEGTSEENIRLMLPKEAQANAKILKVDKYTLAQIEQIHKDQVKK